jgi:hypothetical protein
MTMSDHNTGHEPHGDTVTHGAGHEMDVPPTKELFNIVWGLGALTLLSLVTCVQLFNNQQRDIMDERGKESSLVLAQYRQGMDAVTKSSGEVTFKDSTGAEIKQRYVPLAVARDLVLSKPERMQAAPAPKGWMHPDDIAAGAAAGASGAAPGAVQAPPGAGTVPVGTPEQGGAIVPGNPGTLPGPSVPGAPAGDPKIDGAAGAATGATGTTDQGGGNPMGGGLIDPKAAQPGVPPATGAGAGNGKTDAGKSGDPQPKPTPSKPGTPAPATGTSPGPVAPAPAH